MVVSFRVWVARWIPRLVHDRKRYSAMLTIDFASSPFVLLHRQRDADRARQHRLIRDICDSAVTLGNREAARYCSAK